MSSLNRGVNLMLTCMGGGPVPHSLRKGMNHTALICSDKSGHGMRFDTEKVPTLHNARRVAPQRCASLARPPATFKVTEQRSDLINKDINSSPC
jgi:hypothetical protein